MKWKIGCPVSLIIINLRWSTCCGNVSFSCYLSKEHENMIDTLYVGNSIYPSSASKTSSKSSSKSITCKKAVFSSSSAWFTSNWLMSSG